MNGETTEKITEKFELQKGVLKNLKYDVPSGIVVFLVALPLCLGIAMASDVPLFAGVIAGIIGGLIVPIISRSSLSVSGPAAGLIAIVISAIADLGSFEAFLLALVLAGIIQMVLGILRAGLIAYFFPSSVIKGMLAGIGVILVLKQIPHALGYDVDFLGDLNFMQGGGENTFSSLIAALHHIHPGAVIISLFSLFVLVNWNKISFLQERAWLPAPLFVVIMGALINYVFIETGSSLSLLDDHLVSLPTFDTVSEFTSQFKFPDFSAITNGEVFRVALTLGIVASVETLLSIEAVDKLDPFKRDTRLSRELIAQGMANSLSGLLGGLPITSVIVRSSANISSKGRTRTSTVLHGFLLLISVLFLPRILNYIPFASLAAILLTIGYKLAKPALFKDTYKLGMDQFIPFVVTVVAVVMTDLLIGISVGIAVGIFFILRSNFHSAISVKKHKEYILIKLNKDVSFLNKATLVTTLDRLKDGSNVILNGEDSEYVDKDVLEILVNFYEGASFRNINAVFVGFNNLIEDNIEEAFDEVIDDKFFPPVVHQEEDENVDQDTEKERDEKGSSEQNETPISSG